jgi:hypothetical protein
VILTKFLYRATLERGDEKLKERKNKKTRKAGVTQDGTMNWSRDRVEKALVIRHQYVFGSASRIFETHLRGGLLGLSGKYEME